MDFRGIDLSGRAYSRGGPGYEAARTGAVWNGRKPDRFPDLIVVATSVDDVVATVRLARERGVKIGIRAGGHSWVGNHVRDGGILLDLSELREVTVDSAAATAAVQPGITGDILDPLLAEHDLFFPLGHCSDVGISGFMMGGGYGWNSRLLGPACFSIEAVEVVTADGELVWSDDHTNQDLIWAVRGGGPGFFGVVTRFHLRLHPRPQAMLRSVQLYPLELAGELLRWTMEIGMSLDPAVELVALGNDLHLDGHAGPGVILSATALAPSREEAVEMLAVLEGCPVLDQALVHVTAVPGSLKEFWVQSDVENPKGMRYAADNIWSAASPDELVPMVERVFATMPTLSTQVFWYVWGPDHTPGNAAWSAQAPWYLAIYASWEDTAQDAAMQGWVTGSIRSLEHLSAGTQFADADPATRFDAPLSAANLERMEQLRAVHDPGGVFHGYVK